MGLRGDLLVAEYQHVVVEVCLVDALEVFGVDRPGDVEADDFGADGGVEGAHFEVLRRCLCLWLVVGNGCHAANVGVGLSFTNELFVDSL